MSTQTTKTLEQISKVLLVKLLLYRDFFKKLDTK